jgi:hypothetical protein
MRGTAGSGRIGAIALAMVLGVAACGGTESSHDDIRSGFQLAEAQVTSARSEVLGHPAADRWEVEVAWVKPEIATATLFHDLPPGSDDDQPEAEEPSSTTAPSPEPNLTFSGTPTHVPNTNLTPIPSPGLSWGSSATPLTYEFSNPTVIGSPLIFLVTENRGDWLKVLAPLRPNQQEVWISADDVNIKSHQWHVEVNVTSNSLQAWDGDELVFSTAVVAGTSYTPTPLGRFYINEMQQGIWSAPTGSYILSTNGFSDTLERFGGEVPIFAIHGTSYAASVGQDLSNGCIRIPNELVLQMAATVPVGTPVDVVA